MRPAVRARGLRRRFGAIEAVRGVDLEVFPGEVFGLLGPNGAGKTTTVRMLTGVLRPSEGEAWVLGKSVVKEPEAVKATIGYATQEASVYPYRTVRQNLEFRAGLYLPRNQVANAVEEALSRFGLAEVARQSAGTLSGGWRQRLALAQALVHCPRAAFLDEPTTGLDPLVRRRIWDLIYAEAGEGAAVLVTTHYMDEAERCHRVGFLLGRRLVAVGEPRAIRAEVGRRYRFAEVPSPPPRDWPGLLDAWQAGGRWRMVLAQGADLPPGAAPAEPTLEDAFVVLTWEDRRAA